ncbi:c-type cytochrome [Salipiger mangrovisoli]|uniref:Cytochrome c n=1 Tax=Salipiger mangrovisoli TaxID=2865933 RepID=A0ABR9WW80_9RHOB|nr:cytochrome c [Salipiger mangrovisoli]MBE9635541.1 cytochrome c [Salipiger mangrovisoli]
MKITATGLALTAGLATFATAALAQELPAPVKARQGQFNILAINLGILGDMARDKAPYDAEAAQMAADTIVAVSMINEAPLFREGTSEMDLNGTRAKAEIWDDWNGFAEKWAGLGSAAAQLQQVAAAGPEELGPALGQLGGACKACHDTFRAPE